MNWKRLSVFTSAAMLAGLLCVGAAQAAVVDKTSPYEGEYFIAYNKNMEYFSDDPESVPLPVAELDEEAPSADSSSDYSVIDVTTNEEGETIYRIEYRNLDAHPSPPLLSSRPFAATRRSAAPQVGDEREFVTRSPAFDTTDHAIFVLKYSGEYCNIWLEKSDAWDITDEMATELGMEYDVKIHNKMLESFGPVYDRDGDEKVAFLLYDIQDGFGEYTNAYTGGFFSYGDLWYDYQNCMDVLHIDTYPSIIKWDGRQTLDEAKSIMVHELQHLIEASYCLENNVLDLPTWINEGLSLAAEHMLYGALDGRIQYYNEEAALGTSLVNWADDYTGADSLSNYSYSYLFFQYLRIQTKDFPGGGEPMFRAIIENEHRDDFDWGQGGARSIEKQMRQFYPNINMEDIVRNFYIALILNEPTGIYGFGGEPGFDKIKPRLYEGDESVSLNDGAAVVKRMTSESYTPEEPFGSNICYAAFSPGASRVDQPKANTPAGEIFQFRNVYLSCAERGATIYYTLDGSEPDESSLIYDGSPIQFISSATLKAVTITSDGRRSAVSAYEYEVVPEDVELFRRFLGRWGPCGATGVAAPDGSGFVMVGEVSTSDLGAEDFSTLQPKYSSNGNSSTSYTSMGYITKYGYDGIQQWLYGLENGYQIGFSDIIAVEDGYMVLGDYESESSEHAGDLSGIPMEGIGHAGEWSGGLLAKYDFDGNLKWAKTYPTLIESLPEEAPENSNSNHALFNQVIQTPDGGFICVGYSYLGRGGYIPSALIRTGYSRAIVIKTDANGDVQWRRELSGYGIDGFTGACVLSNGTIIVVGYIGEDSLGTGDWSELPASEKVPNIANQEKDAVIAAYTQQGELLWKKALDWGGQDRFLQVVALDDGGFIATGEHIACKYEEQWYHDGYIYGAIESLREGVLARFDNNGSPQWQKTLKNSLNDGSSFINRCSISITALEKLDDSIMVLADADMYAYFGADLEGLSQVGDDCIVLKYDLDGNLYWKNNYYSNFLPEQGYFWPESLAPLGKGRYVVCGGAGIYDSSIPNHSYFFIFDDGSTPRYKVSGNVGLPGVSIGGKLSDSQGNYSVKVEEGKSVTLTPTLDGYTFEPASRTIGPVTDAVTGVDFNPSEITYTLQGKVTGPDGAPLSGVTLAQNVVTGADGTYTVTVRPGSSVLLEPQAEGKSFSPVSISRTAITESENGLDFQALRPKHTISGKVTLDGRSQGGVEVFKGVLTEPDGTYSFTVEEGTVVTLAPRFQNYTFSPVSASLGAVAENKEQNFAMELKNVLFKLQAVPESVVFGTLTEGYTSPTAVSVTVKNIEGSVCAEAYVFLPENSDFEASAPSKTTIAAGDEGAVFAVKPKAGLSKGQHTATVEIRKGGKTLLTIPVSFTVEGTGGEPDNPDPDKPDPDKPGPDNPDPDKPDPDKPSPDKPDPDKPDPDKPDPDKPDPDTPDDDDDDDSSSGSSGGSGSGGSSSKPSKPTRPATSPTQEPATSQKPAQTVDHTPYVNGYEDGAFLPEANLTRGQCAAILSRLMGGFEPERSYGKLPFPDVREDAWYYHHIGYMTTRGLIKGYPDGTFRPDEPISRAEFSILVRNALRLENISECSFPDVQAHWAIDPIGQLSQAGILDGYPDGTFRPDAPISRAEAVKVLNGAYRRSPVRSDLDGLEVPFTDLYPSHWAYYDILEAALEHKHTAD